MAVDQNMDGFSGLPPFQMWLMSQFDRVHDAMTRLVRDVEALKTSLENTKSAQATAEEKIGVLDARVKVLETDKTRRDSAWTGPKILLTAVASIAAIPLAIIGTITMVEKLAPFFR